MDTVGDPDITFDEKGVCNYYYEYKRKAKHRLATSMDGEDEIRSIVSKIRQEGRRREYDCVVGVSGGVDSTYTVYVTKQLGLRPLAVHFDNGWNSELAVSNIEKVLRRLEIELHTYVVDWEEFKNLQLSFLKASTPDGEIPTDHAILAVLYKVAGEYNIPYIITGNNFRTEGVMPPSWAYGHIDWRYIKAVHKLYGNMALRTFPHLSLLSFLYYTVVKKIRLISLLNYLDYDRTRAMQVLEEEVGWKYYGGKHYESVYTKFYQGYVLPRKFNIDKRKLHVSTLVFAGLLDRESALRELEAEPYPVDTLKEDRDFVIKKLGLSEEDLDRILRLPLKSFKDYHNSYHLHKYLRSILGHLRKRGIFYK
jgi:N-acetyl sugar amidotransferase